MKQELMLIMITAFAVLGAYHLSELVVRALWSGTRTPRSVLLVAVQTPEQAWSSAAQLRGKMPEQELVLVYPRGLSAHQAVPEMRGVCTITADVLAPALCEMLQIKQEV